MWFKESNRYFCKIENFAYGEISEQSFSNPHPWTVYPIGPGRLNKIFPQKNLDNFLIHFSD